MYDMKSIEQLYRLQRMNDLIRSRKTGTPVQLSDTLGISKRQLYCDLDYCRDLGLSIGYSKQLQTFYYSDGSELDIRISIRIITDSEVRKIIGGFGYNQGSVLFLCTQAN
jgi:hypothetical protein